MKFETSNLFMSSNDIAAVTSGVENVSLDKEPKMREFRRPTLCVIDENGLEVAHNDENDNPTGSDDENEGSDVKITLPSFLTRDFNSNVTKLENSNFLNPNVDEKDLDLNELKATTARLKLTTRRQSTVAWQQKHLNESRNPVIPKLELNKSENYKDDTFTEERKNRINEALAWLRNELQQMRQEDEVLARKLLSIRHDIHQLKLQRSCEEHKEMLEDVTMNMEEDLELLGISDLPLTDSVHGTPLRHLGVTRMNLSARRFSTC